MPAHIAYVMKLPVGERENQNDPKKPFVEYREIGVVLEMTTKNGDHSWLEARIHADILNPVLFQLTKGLMEKGSSMAKVKLFEPPAKRQPRGEPADTPPPSDDEELPPNFADGDDIPF